MSECVAGVTGGVAELVAHGVELVSVVPSKGGGLQQRVDAAGEVVVAVVVEFDIHAQLVVVFEVNNETIFPLIVCTPITMASSKPGKEALPL